MKFKLITALATACCCAPLVGNAQSFDSGSTGSMGAFNPTASTNLQVPPDGIFHFTTVTIPANVLVTFTPNALNTPVYVLATSNVTIVQSGSFDVEGFTAKRSAEQSRKGRTGRVRGRLRRRSRIAGQRWTGPWRRKKH